MCSAIMGDCGLCTICSALLHWPRLFFLILKDLNQKSVLLAAHPVLPPTAGFMAPVIALGLSTYLAFLELSTLRLLACSLCP